jgi:hypothetical protein
MDQLYKKEFAQPYHQRQGSTNPKEGGFNEKLIEKLNLKVQS